jgi:hypothetical protein
MTRTLKITGGLAFLIFIAWFVVPNLLRAENRYRQRETLNDIRAIATAWEARATDTNFYAAKGERVTPDELARSLEPTYINRLPRRDGWGTAFQFSIADYDKAGQAQTYTIRSFGSDGRPDRVANLSGVTKNFTDDIIYSNGSFIRYPEDVG